MGHSSLNHTKKFMTRTLVSWDLWFLKNKRHNVISNLSISRNNAFEIFKLRYNHGKIFGRFTNKVIEFTWNDPIFVNKCEVILILPKNSDLTPHLILLL